MVRLSSAVDNVSLNALRRVPHRYDDLAAIGGGARSSGRDRRRFPRRGRPPGVLLTLACDHIRVIYNGLDLGEIARLTAPTSRSDRRPGRPRGRALSGPRRHLAPLGSTRLARSPFSSPPKPCTGHGPAASRSATGQVHSALVDDVDRAAAGARDAGFVEPSHVGMRGLPCCHSLVPLTVTLRS